MLNIGSKTFMNLQEAVGWLLENNALPFQSTANYAGNTEIAMSTLINPSPAKVRVGSIIFFADSKVSTVIGVTSNSFIVSDQYNDLVDDVVYVSNVAINASGHLIVTLSNGNTIDAGLIKQVSNFSIDGSQHLIATYNDGSTTDLGAIFSGDISISGNLTATGTITGNTVTGNTVLEIMSGYGWSQIGTATNTTREYVYAGISKTGNKLTLVVAINLTNTTGVQDASIPLCRFGVPADIASKLYPTTIGLYNFLALQKAQLFSAHNSAPLDINVYIEKSTNAMDIKTWKLNDLVQGTKYYLRCEFTFLLSENLAA